MSGLDQPGLTDQYLDEFVSAWVQAQVEDQRGVSVFDPFTGLLTGTYLLHRLNELVRTGRASQYALIDVRITMRDIAPLTDAAISVRLRTANLLRQRIDPLPAAVVAHDHYSALVSAEAADGAVSDLQAETTAMALPAGTVVAVTSREVCQGPLGELEVWLHG